MPPADIAAGGIFGYKMSNDGVVTIHDLWLKNVWEICRAMEKWALRACSNLIQ